MSTVIQNNSFIKVKDVPGLVRGENGAILSVDEEALIAYRRRRARDGELGAALTQINTLRAEMQEIRLMLYTILTAKQIDKA